MNVYFGYLNLKYYEDSLKILRAKSFQRYLNLMIDQPKELKYIKAL